MIQLWRVLYVCLLFWRASTLKVKQALNVIPAETAETQRQPYLEEVIGLSPDKWGLKAISDHVEHPPSAIQSKGDVSVPDLPGNYLALSASARISGSNSLLVTTLLLWVVVMVFFFAALGGQSEEKPGDEASGPTKTTIGSPVSSSGSIQPGNLLHSAGSIQPGIQWEHCSIPPVSPATNAGAGIHARSSPVEPFIPMAGSIPNEASSPQENEQDALNLCMRCEIFSAQEYANNRISQEHIDECLWIAKTMLRQMPLEEWVALSQHSRQSFEDSVDALLQVAPMPPSFTPNPTPNPEFRVPLSKGMLKKGTSGVSSNVSLGSEVSFKIAEPEKVKCHMCGVCRDTDKGEVPGALTSSDRWQCQGCWRKQYSPRCEDEDAPLSNSKQLPFKSPVAIVNCGDQVEDGMASTVGSTGSTQVDMEEGMFASVFSSTTISATTSPQDSQRSSPLEPAKVPDSGFTVPSTAASNVPNSPFEKDHRVPAVRFVDLSPQEVIIAPPPQATLAHSPGRLLHFDSCSPPSPRQTISSVYASSSSSSSRTQLGTASTDSLHQQRVQFLQ